MPDAATLGDAADSPTHVSRLRATAIMVIMDGVPVHHWQESSGHPSGPARQRVPDPVSALPVATGKARPMAMQPRLRPLVEHLRHARPVPQLREAVAGHGVFSM